MTTQKDPSPEARSNVTDENIETRAQLLPQAARLARNASATSVADALRASQATQAV